MTTTTPTPRIISVIRTSIGFLDIPVNETDLQKAQEMAVAMAADMEFTSKESSIEPVDGWHTEVPDRKESEIAQTLVEQGRADATDNWYPGAMDVLQPLRWHVAELVDAAKTANRLSPFPVMAPAKLAAAEAANFAADQFFSFASKDPQPAAIHPPAIERSMIEPVDSCHMDVPERKAFEIAAPDLAQRIAKRLISESQPFEMTRNADGTFQISAPYPGTQVSAEIEDHAQESSPEAHAQRERLVRLANETFGSNTLQIDAEAPHSEGDDGTWVPAWVLVQPIDDENDGPQDQTP